MDEKLRLVLELQNKASSELRKFGKDLEGVKPTAGMKNTANWFQMLEGASENANKALRPLAGGLSTIGTGGLAAGLSIAGLVQQFRDLAKQAPALQELSRQTGMTRTELERLKYAGRNLNIDPSKMTAGLEAFSREMVQFSIQSGRLYGEMQNGAAPLAEKIAKEWKDHPEAALKDYLRWLAAIPDAQRAAGKSSQEGAQKQRYWAGQMFGDEDMAQLVSKGMGGFDAAMEDARKNVAEVTSDLIAEADKLNQSINAFDQTWKNFETTVGPTVFEQLRHATDDFRAVFKEVEGAVEWYNKVKDHPIQAAAEAALDTIDGKAKRNAEHPEGIIVDVPGLLSKGLHALMGDRPKAEALPNSTPLTLRAPAPVPRAFQPIPAPAPAISEAPGILSRGLHYFTDPGPAAAAPAGGVSHAAAPFHPDDDRLTRARASDAPDRSLDSFAVGELGREVIHLRDTLKTANRGDDSPVHQAAFRGAGFNGLTAALDPGAVISAAVKEGTLSAFREWAGMQDLDAKGSGPEVGGGLVPAAYHPGGGVPGGRSAAAAGEAPAAGGGQGSSSSGGGGHSPAAAGRARGGGADPSLGRFEGDAPGANGFGLINAPYRGALDAKGEGGHLSPRELFNHLKAQGATDNEATMLTGAAGSESSFNPNAVHDIHSKNGPGHGLWGHNDHRINMAGLSWQQQADRALAEVKQKYAAQVNAAKTPEELALAEMRYEAPRGYLTRNPRGGDNYTGRLNTLRRFAHGFGTMGFDPAKPMPQPAAEPPPNTGTSHVAAGHVDGVLKVGDESFRYGSGGRNGAAHIPFGDHEVTPGAVGAWGASHGAMGLDGNAMWDPALKRMRTGIELHAAKSAELITSGCLGFMEEQYPRLKSRVHEMIAKTGRAYLHIDGKGASITPSPRIEPMPAITPEPPRAQTEHRVSMDPLHVSLTHQENGRTRVAVKHGEGVKVTLRTAPTMVETG